MLFKPCFALFFAVAWGIVCAAADAPTQPFGDKVCLRGSLDNARLTFERTGKGTVAFLGGSITEMEGYRPRVCAILQKRFPQTSFTFINAGISSTCSTTGAFRLGTDVLGQGPVDLLFVEFAVNDDQDGHHTRAECVRGMEGIVRHLRQACPRADAVMTFFVNEAILKSFQDGHVPLTVEAHTAVAERYGVSTISLAQEVAEEMTAGALTWEKYGGVHPAPFGNDLCAQMIDQLLSRAWSAPLPPAAALTPHALPSPLDPLCYAAGRFVNPAEAKIKQGWALGVPEWQKLAGDKRDRFTSLPMLCATEPGAELTLNFEGSAVGAYVVAGPDAGMAEVVIDGGAASRVNFYHPYSKGLHYPRTVMLGTDLKPGRHTLTLRVAAETESAGHALRIMQFGAN